MKPPAIYRTVCANMADLRSKLNFAHTGRHCMYRGLHFYEIIYYILRTGFFIHHSTILGVKRVELVSDRMLHIVMRGCR
jgi:hypothetical protein